MFKYITPEKVVAAANLVHRGRCVVSSATL